MDVGAIQSNERVTFGVRYSDEHMLIVDKPARVVTHPGVGHEHDTLLNGLFARHERQLRQLGKDRDWGLVHRLDRETSGLVAVALTIDAHAGLRAAFAERRVKKFYLAVTTKAPREDRGVIKKPITEHTQRLSRYTSQKTARFGPGGKPATTAYRVLAVSDTGEALIEARPVTGRLHQVRAHLASIGAGILGDEHYGPKRTTGAASRLALHAHRLGMDHPVTGEPIDARSPMPKDMKYLMRRVGLPWPLPKKTESEDA